MNRFDILIRNPNTAAIVEKVMDHADGAVTLDSIISADTPFGIPTNPTASSKAPLVIKDKPTGDFCVALHYLDGAKRVVGYVKKAAVRKNEEDIDCCKVFIPKAGGSGADKLVLGKPIIAGRNSVCSQTYLYVKLGSRRECENFVTYLQSKFLRLLVSARKVTQDALSKVYSFVPIQDFSEPWTDEKLYAKYGITPAEQKFIESMIKPMG